MLNFLWRHIKGLMMGLGAGIVIALLVTGNDDTAVELVLFCAVLGLLIGTRH